MGRVSNVGRVLDFCGFGAQPPAFGPSGTGSGIFENFVIEWLSLFHVALYQDSVKGFRLSFSYL